MYILEHRVCICGCGRSFRCLPSSKARYFSVYDCQGTQPNENRLEFTGKTVKYKDKTRRRKKQAKAYTRNFSKWDK